MSRSDAFTYLGHLRLIDIDCNRHSMGWDPTPYFGDWKCCWNYQMTFTYCLAISIVSESSKTSPWKSSLQWLSFMFCFIWELGLHVDHPWFPLKSTGIRDVYMFAFIPSRSRYSRYSLNMSIYSSSSTSYFDSTLLALFREWLVCYRVCSIWELGLDANRTLNISQAHTYRGS